MKKYLLRAAIAACVIFTGQDLLAQDQESKEIEKMNEKIKSKDEQMRSKLEKLAEHDEIIIRSKEPGTNGKVTIEIKDGKVTVDGKPIEEYKNDELAVLRRSARHFDQKPKSAFRSADDWRFGGGEEGAFLGVSTEASDQGARVVKVSDNSAAEKAGLKKDDIIVRVNGTAIGSPEALTEAISDMKPDQKIDIVYKREGKEHKTTATLGKRKGGKFGMASPDIAPFPSMDFNMQNGELDQLFSFAGKARLGIKAQDTEDGKGVKVLAVDEGSAADKAGIKEEDLITSFEGKDVNSADELAKASRGAKDKSSLKIQLKRNGKSQTVEVKVPRKLKTANL